MPRSKHSKAIKDFSLVHHKLIPFALIAGNISLPHLIYSLVTSDNNYATGGIILSLALLATGTLKSNKYVLLVGIVLYSLILVLSL